MDSVPIDNPDAEDYLMRFADSYTLPHKTKRSPQIDIDIAEIEEFCSYKPLGYFKILS